MKRNFYYVYSFHATSANIEDKFHLLDMISKFSKETLYSCSQLKSMGVITDMRKSQRILTDLTKISFQFIQILRHFYWTVGHKSRSSHFDRRGISLLL